MVLLVEVSPIRTLHAPVFHEVENVRISTAVHTFVCWLVEERSLGRTQCPSCGVRYFPLDFLKIAIVVHVLGIIQVSFEPLLARFVNTLTSVLIKEKPFITLTTVVFVKVPEMRQIAFLTLSSIEVPPVFGAFWVLVFVLRNFSDKVLCFYHVAVVNIFSDESVALAFSWICRERVTLFTKFALVWLEIEISWKLAAQTLLAVRKWFVFRAFDHLLSLCFWLVRRYFAHIIFDIVRKAWDNFWSN